MDNYGRIKGYEPSRIGPALTFGLVLLLIQCIILFSTENYNIKGQANYCTVKDSATEKELYLCAASKFYYRSSACFNVYDDDLEASTNMSFAFNSILWFHLI